MEDNNASVIITYSFVFLFIVYIFLQQGDIIPQTTGYAFFDADVLSGLSLTTLIILLAALVILIVGGFFLYKKLKKKKEQSESNLEIPKPDIYEKSISDLSKEFNIPANEEKAEKSDVKEAPEATPAEQEDKIGKVKEKEFNLDELKQILKVLMKKSYTKESIVKYLNSKGHNLMQIKQAINSINNENLRNYVKNALSQGFSKQDVMQALLKSGWNKEDIIRNMQ